uniref:Uncharacterized protein n=1 Tax=Grammatophora oceanica TaxID=210454 RepID=A0A7S1UZJ7_9STRA|mmetsp:Transcript_30992/g.45975  ORF Transcript_30992/g.45975 Transcript_30992/m.45975 type:complete len:130 (+) Transcript_30992:158-547(+)|eukprot:CAMPEP_0194059878 /NCGR_PEP_ID=MMETSP0009_2-20130614/70249_1 /TAXON_ID=210454 /ORGANISM="Grammatophora oceanica, Strain CCMP 410" /LENGTH=129 /DNA_ID=CAMNT_0038710601 /DNA_START=140 /DNA_END=529 /DNA_ORIENTATION=+
MMNSVAGSTSWFTSFTADTKASKELWNDLCCGLEWSLFPMDGTGTEWMTAPKIPTIIEIPCQHCGAWVAAGADDGSLLGDWFGDDQAPLCNDEVENMSTASKMNAEEIKKETAAEGVILNLGEVVGSIS